MYPILCSVLQILSGRTEKRQLGAKKGNSFSVATFATEEASTSEAPRPRKKKGGVDDDRAFWAEMLPEAVQEHDERVGEILM